MNAKQLTAAETIVMKCIWDADHEMSLVTGRDRKKCK